MSQDQATQSQAVLNDSRQDKSHLLKILQSDFNAITYLTRVIRAEFAQDNQLRHQYQDECLQQEHQAQGTGSLGLITWLRCEYGEVFGVEEVNFESSTELTLVDIMFKLLRVSGEEAEDMLRDNRELAEDAEVKKWRNKVINMRVRLVKHMTGRRPDSDSDADED
ncbi:MAG: hypothetical protein Q9159_001397 [Coniocarpon cinnabarinum]